MTVLVDTATGWGRDIIRGVHRQAETLPRWRLWVEARGVGERVRFAEDWAPHGVIARVADAELARELTASGLPVVNVSAMQLPEARFPRVATDVEAAGRMAAEYFSQRGFRSFAYISTLAQDYVVRQRAAFAGAVRAAGHRCDEWSPPPGKAWPRRPEAERRVELARWLGGLPRPAGVFTWSGGSELVRAARQAGLTVPEEVAVLSGSDDDLLCEVCEVPISAVRQPAEQIGSEAAALLERLMNGDAPPQEPRWLPPPRIVTRRSTDTLAVGDPWVRAALRFIRERGCEPVQVADVAVAAGLSRRSLERRFALHLTGSPAVYLRRARMARAKALLAETDRAIPEVAALAGFGSAEYLAQAFREELEVSPLRFRRASRGR